MKNNFIIYFIVIFFFYSSITSAQEEILFESNEIQFDNSSNIIKADNGVIAKTNDGIEISATQSTYFRNENKLELEKNIIINDTIEKIKIFSEKIIYDKKYNKITSESTTKVLSDLGYEIIGSDIIFLRNDLVIKSNEIAIIKDNLGNESKVFGFFLSLEERYVKSSEIEFFDEQKNLVKSKNAFILLDENKIASKDLEIFYQTGELGENARLKGTSMISENNLTEIKNGIFTTCKINDDCPAWSIKSKKITHDKNKKIINYDKSVLQLYDIPIFYFPKFFHPDPSVKRQSGFLAPSIISSNSIGNSLVVPYYKVLSDNKDFTFSPRFYFNNDYLMQNEYRHKEKNSNHMVDFSIKKLQKNTKSHLFANSKFLLNNNFEYSDLEINFENTSNDTYLKKNRIISNTKVDKNNSTLNSFIKYNAINKDFTIFAEFGAFEDLSKNKNSDKYQYIFPNFSINKLIDSNLSGDLNYVLSGSNIEKNTNTKETYLINDINYTSQSFFSKIGIVSNFEILLKNALKKGKNSTSYENKTKSKNSSSVLFNSSLPLKKESDIYSSKLSPRLLARYNPDKSINLKNLDRKINYTNIFATNRLGLTDTIEGGKSVSVGLEYDVKNKLNQNQFIFGLGQIFREREDKNLPIKSKMQNKSSDIVGNILFKTNENFKLEYDFSADNNLDTMNLSKVNTEISINNFVTSFDFLEENNEIGSNSYLTSDIKYMLNKSSSLRYNNRRNRKTNLTEFYNIIYEYKNDCLVAAIQYNKDYYQDRDLKPSEEFFISLTFTPITTVASPNLK